MIDWQDWVIAAITFIAVMLDYGSCPAMVVEEEKLDLGFFMLKVLQKTHWSAFLPHLTRHPRPESVGGFFINKFFYFFLDIKYKLFYLWDI